MSWQDFYLVCFLVGFALSFVSFLLGSFHFHFHFHGHTDVFHAHFHAPDAAHAGGSAAGHVHGGGDAVHAGAHVAPSHGLNTGEPEMPWLNFGTITAFLAWFGAAGYILTRYSHWLTWLSLSVAIMTGLLGAFIMFWFIAKVLMKHDKSLDPLDYEMVGVLGTVSVPIREDGTGEIVFLQEDVRRCCGARADKFEAIPKGTEVIVTRYEKGIAYVRQWEEMANGIAAVEGKEA